MIRFDYGTVTSTSDIAGRLHRLNPFQELLVTATSQTRGRGRSGRLWQSPVGGAWFSIVCPLDRAGVEATALPLVVGLAVRGVIEGLGVPSAIKWPNDVLVGDHKLAGVLCENLNGRAVVIGVGINVTNPVQDQWASLAQHLPDPPTVSDVISMCVGRIEKLLPVFLQHGLTEDMREGLARALAWRGEAVSVERGEHTSTGTLAGIDQQGRLVLDTKQGALKFEGGEVRRLRPVVVNCSTSSLEFKKESPTWAREKATHD
ncbi:MAG: biotin--[acetyl-CoA-carboxylase] ligase [Phycisphaera sp.]|nr:biotin--[acetyl-CoA-carboxylase] ligase [Phycisphaera sp.]